MLRKIVLINFVFFSVSAFGLQTQYKRMNPLEHTNGVKILKKIQLGKLSFSSLLKNAEKGDAKSQLMLGDLLYVGNSVTNDAAKAGEWWKKASTHDDSEENKKIAGKAYFRLAIQKSVKEEKKKEFLERAKKFGHPEAEFSLYMLDSQKNWAADMKMHKKKHKGKFKGMNKMKARIRRDN